MAGMMKNTKYLPISEICARYSIDRATLWRWSRDDKTFPTPVLINRRKYYSELDLMRWESARGGVDPDMPDRIHGLKPCSPVITTYQEFIDAMATRRAELNLSVMELDARAGMQEGYASKLENFGRPNGRGIGPDIFPLWLGGLKCGIVLVDLPRRPRKKNGGAD